MASNKKIGPDKAILLFVVYLPAPLIHQIEEIGLLSPNYSSEIKRYAKFLSYGVMVTGPKSVCKIWTIQGQLNKNQL